MSTAPEKADEIAAAATVVLLRQAREGFEVLLMQRAGELAFHGGAWVFPGGRVDAADHVDTDPLEVATRAAARETQEEAGVLVDARALVPFAHWTTPRGRSRRFATWFFVTEVDASTEVVVDGGEIRDHRWLTPRDALSIHAAKQLELPPPTFVTLSVLHRFARLHNFVDVARAQPPAIYLPKPHAVPDGWLSLYGGDVAYESGDPMQAGPRHRLCMLESGWRYDQST